MSGSAIGRRSPSFAALVVAAAIVMGSGPGAATRAAAIGPRGAERPAPLAAEAWTRVEAEPPAAAALLEATHEDAAGVSPTSAFRLTSLDGTPVDELASGLSVEPALALQVEAGTGTESLTLRPERALEAGRDYRFTLRASDAALLGSWVFSAQAPIRVVGTLPGDGRGEVPTDTGIEITFDREGVTDADSFFSIEPAVPGRFETHTDTLVFVPRRRLAPATVYRVTLEPGAGLEGSDLRLEEGVRFEFKTATSGPRQRPPVTFSRLVTESPTADRPLLMLDWTRAGREIPVEVYRIGRLAAAVEAVHAAQEAVHWDEPLAIDTSGLERVGSHSLEIRGGGSASGPWLQLPGPLPPGWYVVVLPDERGDAQVVLQVSDLAVFSQVTETDSLAWVNDAASGDPVAGAEVSLDDGTPLGRTGPDGLLRFETPSLEDSSVSLLVEAADRAVLVPFGASGWMSDDILPCWAYQGDCERSSETATGRYWHLLYTDRLQYRPTDTVGVFGTVRDRDTGLVPETVSLQLRDYSEDVMGPPPLAAVEAAPASSGAFSAQLALDGLATGYYVLELVVDGSVLTVTDVVVNPIVKPDYRIELSTDRHVAIAGQTIESTVQATFFEGTSLPALPVEISSGDTERAVVTDAFGTATAALPAFLDGGAWEQWAWQRIDAWPGRGDEAEIDASTDVLVFRSAFVLSGEATIDDGRADFEGSLARVALGRLQRDPGVPWDVLDPAGQPAAGAAVTAQVTERIPTRTQTGTVYDFIAKRSVPVYEYGEERRSLGTFDLVSGPDGGLRLTFPADPANDYTVDLQTRDGSGRATRLRVYAQDVELTDWWRDVVYVAPPGVGPWPEFFGEEVPTYAVGELVEVTLHAGADAVRPRGDDRYLFAVAQRGLLRTVLQDSPELSTPFLAADVPSVTIAGVRWTGSTYLADARGYTAGFRPDDREVSVELTPERLAYEPGGTVELDLLTTDAQGTAVSADVVVRAVDEKLFAIGAAGPIEPLADLYAPVPAGWRASYASHQVPRREEDGLGDAGGGGDGPVRSDFRDALLFRQVTTDAQGRAHVSFDLSDDLTTWHVGATALTEDLGAGEASLLVPVSLPFFAEVVMAPEYVVGDEAAVRLRSYGRGLEDGDAVVFTVEAPTLGGEPVRVEAEAFAEASVGLPRLTLGTHDVTVRAAAGAGADALSDALLRRIVVVEPGLELARFAQAALDGTLTPRGGPGTTSIAVADAGRGRFHEPLADLVADTGPRADQAISAAEARRLLVDVLGVDEAGVPRVPTDLDRFQEERGGIALFPYASPNLELSMLAALAAPDVVDADALARYLDREGTRRGVTRARAIMALAGLAALGRPVIDPLRTAARQADLGLQERLHVAIGLAEGGDHAAALDMERALLADAGEQRGAWIRLAGESPSQTSALTALLSILAARLGDDGVAVAADAYVRADPPKDTLASLQRLAYTARSLDRATSEPARFAWGLGGERQVVELEPGRTFSMALSAGRLADLVLERLDGSMVVTSSWTEPADRADVAGQDEAITVTRSVTPRGSVPDDATVVVRIDVTLDPPAVRGCYLVTERVPAGLAPLVSGERGEELGRFVEWPWEVSGQRVTFCAYRDERDPVTEFGYLARVVTPGRYAWQPTLVQSDRAPESWRLGPAGQVVTE